MPAKTISGDRLTEPPAIEILRGALKPDGSPDAKSFRVVSTIPGALVANYRSEDRVQIVVPFTTEELRANPGDTFVYRVRTRASRKRTSPDSNTVSVHIFPVAERIISLQATVTESAIELNWQAPTRTSAGDPLSAISEYRVYRSEQEGTPGRSVTPDLLLSPAYRDTSVQPGRRYWYSVTSVDRSGNESAPSAPVAAEVTQPSS